MQQYRIKDVSVVGCPFTPNIFYVNVTYQEVGQVIVYTTNSAKKAFEIADIYLGTIDKKPENVV